MYALQQSFNYAHPYIVQGVSNAHCVYRSKIQMFNCINDSIATDPASGSRVIIMTETNSLLKSKVLKYLPKLKTEETDSLCVA